MLNDYIDSLYSYLRTYTHFAHCLKKMRKFTNRSTFDLCQQSEEDWKFVGLVIDKILLWIFIITALFGTIGFFIQAPIFWEAPDFHNREIYEEPEVLLSAGYYDLYPPAPTVEPSAVSLSG